MKDKQNKINECVSFFSYFKRALKKNEIEDIVDYKVHDDDLDFCKHAEGLYWIGEKEIFYLRKIQDEVTQTYLKRAIKGAKWLRILPFIKLVAVCNTVAFKSARGNSDIDLFIITDKNRIFTARILSTILIQLIGMRRHKNKIRGRLCLSFYLSESKMNIQDMLIEKDIYMQYWMKTLLPLYEKEKSYRIFLENNGWASVKNKKNAVLKDGLLHQVLRFPFWLLLISPIGILIENKLKKWHLKRFEKNKKQLKDDSDIRISEEMLKFHNHDKRKEIREGVERIMNSF